MQRVVTRKIPRIVPIRAEDLKKKDLFHLKYMCETEIEAFVICDSRPETILVNRSLACAEDMVPVINKLMGQKYLNTRTERLMDQFEKAAGEKAACTLLSIWARWRSEQTKAELKKTGDEILRRVREKHISKYLRGRENIIHTVFDIGFGFYSEDRKSDYETGAENAFLYGYLCCMENNGIRFAEGKSISL